MEQTHPIHIGEHVLDIVNLPESAQQELVAFYEFLLFKYQAQIIHPRSNRQQTLTQMFQEAQGILPEPYHFNREELHER